MHPRKPKDGSVQIVSPQLTSLIKAPGGKHYLKKWIIAQMPQSKVFCETHSFGLNVLLNRPRAEYEVAVDLNPDVIQFWETVRDHPEELQKRLSRLRYIESTFLKAKDGSLGKPKCPIDTAIRFMVVRRMSRAGMGETFGWSDRPRGGQPGDVNAWANAVKRVPWIARRLAGVHLVCDDALNVISQLDAPDTQFYCDPPYLKETRKAKKVYGPYEMTDDQHKDLLSSLRECRGHVLISGYESTLYNELLDGWEKRQKAIVNHSGQNKKKQKRVETVWSNRPAEPK